MSKPGFIGAESKMALTVGQIGSAFRVACPFCAVQSTEVGAFNCLTMYEPPGSKKYSDPGRYLAIPMHCKNKHDFSLMLLMAPDGTVRLLTSGDTKEEKKVGTFDDEEELDDE
jgi:hypothetical protein